MGITLFNPIFSLVAVSALFLSLWYLDKFKNNSLVLRLSLVGGCLLAVFSSFSPYLARVLTVAFMPEHLVHLINPLTVAPFVVGVIGFAGTWCLLTLGFMFANLFIFHHKKLLLLPCVLAFLILIFLCFEIQYGVINYNNIFNSQRMVAHAKNKTSFPKHQLFQLAHSPNCEIRRAIISNPNISEDLLTQLIAHDPDVGIRRDAKTRLDFLHGLSHLETEKVPPSSHPDFAIKLAEVARSSNSENQLNRIYTISKNSDNPALVLESLANNCYLTHFLARQIFKMSLSMKGYKRTGIQIALALNPQTPVDVLTQMAKEKDLIILRALASNPNLPLGIISKLANFSDCKVRKEVVCLPGTDSHLLRKLVYDKDESVSLEASKRLNQDDGYLQVCNERKKVSPSCQKFYDALAPDMRKYPNTSFLNLKTYFFKPLLSKT